MSRNFEEWLNEFKFSISGYKYYIDFEKVYRNVDNIKIELNILNSLIGSKQIEKDFENIIEKYPETLKCIPILLAVRQMEIYAQDENGEFTYNFKKQNYNVQAYGEEKQYNPKVFHKFQDTLSHYYVNYYRNFELDTENIKGSESAKQ